MFEARGERPGVWRHQRVEDLISQLSATLMWPLGQPQRYDVNTTSQWRAFSMSGFVSDVIGQRIQLVRLLCSEGIVAVDTGLLSEGAVVWMVAGKAALEEAGADVAAAAWLESGLTKVSVHHPPSVAAWCSNDPTRSPEQARARVWPPEPGGVEKPWPTRWGDAPDTSWLRELANIYG